MGPNLGGGNLDVRFLSIAAGDSGVPAGIWRATVALARETASQGTTAEIG